MSRRIAVTGIGLVTALGATREDTWNGLVAGRCGMGPLTLFDSEGYRSRIAGEVAMPPVTAQLTPLERRRWSRSDQFGVIAARKRSTTPGCSSDVDPTRIGVLLGAGTSDLMRNEDYYRTRRGAASTRAAVDAWNHFSSTPVDLIASTFGFEGLRSCIVAACSSSTIAIGQAADAIRAGRIDAALTGGTDALARLTFSGFNALRLMDPEPCRPFDKGRSGMNIGEGAAILVLEELERARARGAHIYAELAGYGFGCEAFHPTAPEPDGRPVSAVICPVAARRRRRPGRGRSRERARHRDAAERQGRGAGVPRRSSATAWRACPSLRSSRCSDTASARPAGWKRRRWR